MKDKIFFVPGDIVILKHELSINNPKMYVVGKVARSFKNDNDMFVGIRCRWYNINLDLQEAIYSSKDLIKNN